ncbi:MAG: IS66 family insertion sequence element accessory protein TnpB [Clostridia bacterium]
MLGDISHVEKIYIRCNYTDMRKQLNGLLDIIQYNFKLDPYSNSLFLFCGKRADRIKVAIMRGTASAFYTNVTKTGAFNGRGPAQKTETVPSAIPWQKTVSVHL